MKPYFQNASVTLYHGDCREVLPAILPSLGTVNLVFTDPPYGHNNNSDDLIARREKALGVAKAGEAVETRPIANDGKEATPLLEDVLKILSAADCFCCCCGGGGGPDPQFARWSLLIDKYFKFAQMVVWDKGPMGMGWHYRRSYETVLVAYGRHLKTEPWYDDSGTVENIIRPHTGIPKIIPSAKQHPTPKPSSLAAKFIKLHTKIGDLVLDPFAGGGSTAVAAMRTGRRAVLCEIDERFCEMSARNIEIQMGEFDFYSSVPSVPSVPPVPSSEEAE